MRGPVRFVPVLVLFAFVVVDVVGMVVAQLVLHARERHLLGQSCLYPDRLDVGKHEQAEVEDVEGGRQEVSLRREVH